MVIEGCWRGKWALIHFNMMVFSDVYVPLQNLPISVNRPVQSNYYYWRMLTSYWPETTSTINWIWVCPDRTKKEIQRPERIKKDENGDAGDRTPCLSHAKRALYHLSYIPYMINFSLIVYLYVRRTPMGQQLADALAHTITRKRYPL
jgi:hypothetical protein